MDQWIAKLCILFITHLRKKLSRKKPKNLMPPRRKTSFELIKSERSYLIGLRLITQFYLCKWNSVNLHVSWVHTWVISETYFQWMKTFVIFDLSLSSVILDMAVLMFLLSSNFSWVSFGATHKVSTYTLSMLNITPY